jgi:hypothetical protein
MVLTKLAITVVSKLGILNNQYVNNSDQKMYSIQKHLFIFQYPNHLNPIAMQKTNVQEKSERITLVTATVLFFSAVILFSLWFTQG